MVVSTGLFEARLLLLLVFEGRNCIDDVLYFFRRLQRLAIFVHLRLFFFVFVAIRVLILVWIAIREGTLTSVSWIGEEHMLLAVVALRELVVLLPLAWMLALALIWLLVVVAIEIYLDARARGLDVVQHILDVIHDAGEVEELLTILSLLPSLPRWHALSLLLLCLCLMHASWTCWPSHSSCELLLCLLEVLLLLIWQPSASVHVGDLLLTTTMNLLVRRLAAICRMPLLSICLLLSTLMGSM